MATPPTCRLCGSVHWSTQPCPRTKADGPVKKGRAPFEKIEEAAPVEAGSPVPPSISSMTVEQLRALLAAKREAKRLSMARYRAKLKAERT